MSNDLITDTNPIRIFAYALHDVFGYNERFGDEGAKKLIAELERKGIAVGVTRESLLSTYRHGYEVGQADAYGTWGEEHDD